MKGIILAGGTGSRLFPITISTSKHLLPVYDKPMIYFPLSILMSLKITEILIILTEKDYVPYSNLLGDGKHLGLNLFYKIQKQPSGIGEAFILGKDFIGDDSVALILGDNFFDGPRLNEIILNEVNKLNGATLFSCYKESPEEYGVIEFNDKKKVLSIEEKPIFPKSNYILTGLYLYDNTVIDIAKNNKPSKRGELEISTINNEYLQKGLLNVIQLNSNIKWLDMGTYDDLLDANIYVEKIQHKTNKKIGCIEEIAYKLGLINSDQVFEISKTYNNEYGLYLQNLIKKAG